MNVHEPTTIESKPEPSNSAVASLSCGVRVTCIFLFAFSLFIPPASADISKTDLDQLGHEKYAVRHAATHKLLADNSLTSQQVAQAYAQAQVQS